MKKKKNNVNADKAKLFIKGAIKFAFYLVLFCVLVFLILYVNSYFWLEGLKIDMDEMMSFDQYDNIRQE